MHIWYGSHVADEQELRLCGDLAGKRVIELGAAQHVVPNAVVMAVAGAKAMALDPNPQSIAAIRSSAEQHEVRVECHQGDLADLGFATSGSVDVVVASHTLDGVEDLPRLLRQVHRVLKPGASFVVAMRHPVSAMLGPDLSVRHPYGGASPTFSDLYMAFERTNFHLDTIHELADRRTREPVAPSVLVLRARKQGV
jgi:ubiquinone/menaquinone biosynthesis C-methylase UbiE